MKKLQVFGISLLFLVFCISLVSAENLSLNYIPNINYGETFSLNITLIDFSSDVYDIKIDIINSSGSRISEIWNGNFWQSTYNYVNDAINTSVTNHSSFLLNITDIYNGTANIEVKVKNSAGTARTFLGYNLTILQPSQQPQNNTQQNQTQNQTQENETEAKIYLKLDYDEEVENGKEFEVNVEAYNLEDKTYDVKIYVTFEENDTIISETYNDKDNKWKSSNYYVEEVFSSKGNQSESFKLRTNDDYKNFNGDVIITARIRENGKSSIVDEIEDNLRIQGREEVVEASEPETEPENQETIQESLGTGNVIKLNGGENIKSLNSETLIYKSKTQYIKEYSIYGFALLCVFLIVVLIIKKL